MTESVKLDLILCRASPFNALASKEAGVVLDLHLQQQPVPDQRGQFAD